MASPAKREAYHFVGQVTDHVGNKALAVWDLDGKHRYHAYPFSLDDFPVGAVVECVLEDPNKFIGQVRRASEEVVAEYRRRLLRPPA
jgi:hypothetical protein